MSSSAAASSVAPVAPKLTVQFLDTTTGKAIKPALTLTGAKVGDKYDLTADTTLPEYTFDAAVSGALTGTYAAGDQTINLCFTPEPIAGTITVHYFDQDGQNLLPDTTINGQVGDAYQLTPVQIPFYTYTNLAVGSLPAAGKLTAAAGDIAFVYQADTAKATVNFVDGVTGQRLETDPLSGLVGSASTYSPLATIAAYEAEGYTVTANDFPAAGVYFLDPNETPTYTVTLGHATTTFTSTSHLDPATLAKLDLSKTITETINYVDDNGQTLAPSTEESVTFTRSVTIDDVTNDVTYSAWEPETTPSFTAETAPTVDGYTPETTSIGAVRSVTPTTADLTETVVYDSDTTPSTSSTTTTPTATKPAAKTPNKTLPATKLPTTTKAKAHKQLATKSTKAAKSIKTVKSTKAYREAKPFRKTKATTKTTATTPKPVATTKATPTAAKAKTLHLIRPTTAKQLAQPMATTTAPVYNDRGQLVGTTRTPAAKTLPGKHFALKKHTGTAYRHLATGLPQTGEPETNATGFLGLLMLGLSSLLGYFGLSRKRHEH